MPEIQIEEVVRFMEDSLVAMGAPEPEAKAQAALLIHADVSGHFSHGLNRLEMYVHDIRNGSCNPKAKPVILKESAATAWVDACDALGATVGNFCMDIAIKKAKDSGVGWVVAKLIVEGRELSYETVDNSGINALLNSHDVSEYLQISSNGLEARCDSYSFESVRCTFQVDEGCWYYESIIITPGVMQIGWATKNSHFLNDLGYGIGDDLYSMSYDGCRRLIWYNAKPTTICHLPTWKPGDVLGCLIDVNRKEIIFSMNGQRIAPCSEIFETSRSGFFAAASFMAYQQCRFNFGYEPFKYPPTDRQFSAFNDHGQLTDEQKKVIPRRVYLEQLRCSSVKEDSCTLCFDETACCILEPCGHRGFCSVCTSQLKECPMCRADILNVKKEDS